MAGSKKRHSVQLDADESRRLLELLEANPVFCTVCGVHATWSVNVTAGVAHSPMDASPDRFEPRCSEHNGLPPGTVFHFGSGQPQESA